MIKTTAAVLAALVLGACAPSVEGVPVPVPMTIAEVATAAGPSVVTLHAGTSQGSGVAISDDLVVTNSHVVKRATRGDTILPGGEERTFTVVGVDTDRDIAVVRVYGGGLTPITVCADTACDLHVGQAVVAIGSPRGIVGVVTAGTIAAVDRPITMPHARLTGMSAHTAVIGPGSSGGALLDMFGRLVGINTAASTTPDLGFAIRADDAIHIANGLVK